MSNSFKATLALIALVALVVSYFMIQSQSNWSALTSPYQSLEEMKATGNIEVKSFEAWQDKHKGGERFKAWREALKGAQKSPDAPVQPSTEGE